MITWTYRHPPYIENGTALYNDLIYAYDNGAKYIVVFDSNEDWTEGILQEEHFTALENFWNYIESHPRADSSVERRSAVLLPANYAYGLRGPDDKIWGLWPADNISYSLCVGIQIMLQQHGTMLDIIYDDNIEQRKLVAYHNLIYWNDSSRFPSVMPVREAEVNGYQMLLTLVARYNLFIIAIGIAAGLSVAGVVLVVLRRTSARKRIT